MPDFSTTSKNEHKVGLAIRELMRLGVEFDKTSPWQLKVGPWNFYPQKGTIYKDGEETKARERGLEAFVGILSGEGYAGKRSYRRVAKSRDSYHELNDANKQVLSLPVIDLD